MHDIGEQAYHGEQRRERPAARGSVLYAYLPVREIILPIADELAPQPTR
jgi:hypothetical protein